MTCSPILPTGPTYGHNAYVAGKRADGHNDVVVGLASDLGLLGNHGVRQWVLREDERTMRVRQTGPFGAAKVEVAWIQH
jgi:hypothetical protein